MTTLEKLHFRFSRCRFQYEVTFSLFVSRSVQRLYLVLVGLLQRLELLLVLVILGVEGVDDLRTGEREQSQATRRNLVIGRVNSDLVVGGRQRSMSATTRLEKTGRVHQ